jgi:hypothetical protein
MNVGHLYHVGLVVRPVDVFRNPVEGQTFRRVEVVEDRPPFGPVATKTVQSPSGPMLLNFLRP